MKPIELVRRAWRRLDESLLVRLVASFSVLVFATAVLAAGAAFFQARAVLQTSILDRLRTVAFVKEGELNRWVEHQRNDLVFLSATAALRDDAARLAAAPAGANAAAAAARGRIRQLLESAAGMSLDMDEVFLLSAIGGQVLVSTDSSRVGDYRVGDLFFVRGKARTWIQNVYPSPVSGRPTITAATPVRGPDGATVAVLAGHLNLARIDAMLAERSGLGKSGEAYLVSQLNDFVSSRRFGRAEVRRGVHTEGVVQALAGHNDAGRYDNYAGAAVLGAYRWNPARQLALMVEMESDEAFAPARTLALTILLLGLGAGLVATGGAYLIGRRIVRPVLAVARTASAIAAGDTDAVAPVETRDEIGALARSFNDMTARLSAVHRDLSGQVEETRRAYRALATSQQLLQAVVDNTANLIVVLDPQGRFLLVNRRFEDLFHLRHNDVRGLAPLMVLPTEAAEALAAAATAALAGRPAGREIDLEVDNTIHHYHLVAFPLQEQGQPPIGVGLVGMDLSERTRAEEERRRLEAGVQQAQKLESLGLLAGGIAHDFNNILTAIVGGTSLALQELGPNTAVRADLEQVVASAERAAKLTRQMLAYAGRASFAIETFDLNRVIREMAELIAVSVPKQVTLSHELAPGVAGIRADRTQISQVVLNLITNAAEATAEQGGRVVMRTGERRRDQVKLAQYRFMPSDVPAFVELVVEDNGIGIQPDTLERMFDPFFSTKGSGRGLGLAAVLGIVRQSGGTLRVESSPGQGTRFTVLFPLAAGVAVDPSAEAEGGAARKGSGTVLLVDDEAMVRRATRRVLERAGYEVLDAKDGREAVDLFRTEGSHIDAVILDVTMPVMGGAEAFTQMRAMGPPVPVIVSSGYDQQDTVKVFTGEGVEFLQKPYRPDQLLARLQRMARQRGGEGPPA